MALEEGTEGQEKKNIPNEELYALVTKLSKEVESLREEKKAAIMNGPIMSAEDIAKIITATKGEKDIDYQSGIREEEIPEEDYDEKGVRFCAPYVGYVLCDDKRKGHLVKLPYGKPFVFFEYGATRRVQQGKYEHLSVFSAYVSHSKKEIEWIRSHRHFGIHFYESSTQAMQTDAAKALRLGKIVRALESSDLSSIIKRCKEYGLEISEDPAITRSHLALRMMEKEVADDNAAAQKAAADMYKTKMLLESKTESFGLEHRSKP